MLVACDVDGVLDADPVNMASLLAALRAAGHRVAILTGASTDQPTEQDVEKKRSYLSELGMGSCWDTLVVFPSPPHKPKAKWCAKNHVDLCFDNSAKNAERASKYCTVLVPWNSIDPPDLKDDA